MGEFIVLTVFIIIPILFGILSVSENMRNEKKRKERQEYRKEQKEFNVQQEKNNNRHSYMYQDVEKEIIKVDHTFSKEVFLNNAKELFLKYYNSIVEGNCEGLKEQSTENFFDIIQNEINENKLNNIKVVVDKIYVYNAFLYEFSKSTLRQVITVKIIAEMKTYEINTKTQFVTEGNKYSKTKYDYEMQFERKTKDIKCQNCGAPANTKDLSVCGYCNTPIEVENNEWKLNSINKLID